MKRGVWCAALGAAVTAVLCAAAAQNGAPQNAASQNAAPLDPAIAARAKRNPPLGDLPPDSTNRYADSFAAAELGHAIFFDTRFSASGTVSCTTCHDPAHGFADKRPIAKGEAEGTRHSMTVLNAAHNRWFTWDGRADTLWAQALQPFESANEQNFPRERVMELIKLDDNLRTRFKNAYGVEPEANDASFALVGKAIAAYERKLVTGPSAYDRWWQKQFGDGDGNGGSGGTAQRDLSAEARRGLEIFFGKGNCWQCHHGATFSDGEFHTLGIPPRDGGMPKDQGRYAVVDGVRDSPFNAAGVHSDDPKGAQSKISAALVRSPDLWGRFKTPSLRGVASRGPYMHAGQFATMQDVVRFYSTLEGATALDHHQEQVLSKLNLSAQEQSDLVEFLKSLEGTPPPEQWRKPPAKATVIEPPSLTQQFVQEVKGTALTFDLVLIPGCNGQPSFYMGRTEVPWELFDVYVYQLDKEGGSTPEADAVTRPTKPYISMDRGFGHAGWPAISMSAKNAQEFCKWLSAKTGREYSIPTLEQWKCAVMASNIPAADMVEYAWVEGNAEGTTHKLATRKRDQAGLHDLFGNAAEWIVEPDGSALVVGGSYRDPTAAVGLNSRVPSTPDWNASDPQFPKSVWWLADGGFIGLRVVSMPPKPAPVH